MLLRWTIFLSLALIAFSSEAHAQRWANVPIPAPYDQGYYLDIFFLKTNPQYGWACDNDSGYVVRTTNGGATWTGTRVGPAGQFCHLEYIQFLDQNTGYCSGPCGVFKSVNGGATWTQLTLPAGVSSIWGSWFRTADIGYVMGGYCGHAQFLRTNDGGQNFTVYYDSAITRSNLSDPLWQPDMPAGTVYAIGNGTLWGSDDDGLSWDVVGYTGTNSPWHEELARFNNSFCIPNAQSNCQGGGYTGGGVRFSKNGGLNWREYTTGKDMFGTWLIDDKTAWASGWNGTVIYTQDTGVTWSDRSCGLGGRNMDDIYFQNDTTGWVVGDGIYRLAKPLRTISDSSLTFFNACPDSSKYDTVWVENINFFSSPWELKFVGPYEYLYRVANVIPKPLPACSRVMVLVEYRATIPGTHAAQLVIEIEDPDTTFVVNLSGYRRAASAVPIDTLIVDSVRAGVIGETLVSRWKVGASPYETIIDITRISGDTSIWFTSKPPLLMNGTPTSNELLIYAAARDTGWITARFRIRLSPCLRDTFITVRVYGYTPIINSIKQVAIDVQCTRRDTLEIPISNTGNIPLTVSRISIQSPASPNSFVYEGFKQGGSPLPVKIPRGGSDTILVSYTPTTGDDAATMIISNDDFTSVRGNVREWNVDMRALSSVPSATVSPRIIELGTVCVGDIIDTAYTVRNDGARQFNTIGRPSSTRITGLSTSASSVSPSTTRTFRFRWTATAGTEFFDTIAVTVQPCDTVEYIILHARIVAGGLVAAPSSVKDSVLVGGQLDRTVVIRTLPGQTVTITNITFDPPTPDLTITAPSVPITIGPSDSIVISLQWLPKTAMHYLGAINITSQASCAGATSVPLDLKSMSNDVVYSPTSLNYLVQCTKNIKYDSVRIESRASSNLTLRAPIIVETGTAFTVVRPTADVVLSPGAVAYAVVAYDPSTSEFSNGTMRFVIDPAGETIDIPLSARFEYAKIEDHNTTWVWRIAQVCDPPKTLALQVFNSGNTDEVVDADISNLQPGVSIGATSFVVAATSSTDLNITGDPAQMNPGFTAGWIDLRGRFCGDVVRIHVETELENGKLILIPDPVNAGTVVLGNSVNRSASVSNPTLNPRVIVSLAIDPPSQDWSLIGSVDGTVVGAGSAIPVQLQFTPTAAGDRNARLVLVDAERCTTTTNIALLGRGQDRGVPPQHSVTLRVDEYRVAPGTHVSIPVRWVGDVPTGIIDTLKFDVDYSGLHYDIDTIHLGNLPDALVTASWIDGKVSVSAARNGPSFGRGGNIVVMSGTATPAIPDSTFFTYSNVYAVTTETTEIVEDEGLLVIDACGPRNMILLKPPTTVRMLPPNPAREVLNLQVVAPYQQMLHITLIDVLGNEVADLGEFTATSGESQLSIPLPQIASGTYGVMVTTDYGGVFNSMQTVVK